MNYIKRTDYFKRPWTWIKTAVILLFVIIVVYIVWDSFDTDSEYSGLKYIVLVLLTFGIMTSPIDDLALDDQYLYHFRTSILPAFSKVKKYEIAGIKNIRLGGMHSQTMEVLQFFTLTLGATKNTIELTMKDDTYQSFELLIFKQELSDIITLLKDRMKKTV